VLLVATVSREPTRRPSSAAGHELEVGPPKTPCRPSPGRRTGRPSPRISTGHQGPPSSSWWPPDPPPLASRGSPRAPGRSGAQSTRSSWPTTSSWPPPVSPGLLPACV
jgi:hypothetical protein